MTSMAKNDYHAIAQGIMDEESAEQPPVTNVQETNGSDGAINDALLTLFQQMGPEAFLAMSAEELMQTSGIQLPPEEAAMYDSMDPATRMEAIKLIASSGGMGSIADVMK
jgi:adenosylmethionine-8-amino-7-oxononanoate aminotransferase